MRGGRLFEGGAYKIIFVKRGGLFEGVGGALITVIKNTKYWSLSGV